MRLLAGFVRTTQAATLRPTTQAANFDTLQNLMTTTFGTKKKQTQKLQRTNYQYYYYSASYYY